MYASALLLLTTAFSAGDVEAGTQLTYRGEMVAEKGVAALTRKTFDLELVVAEKNDEGAVLLWTISEEGRGGWPWPDRFGRFVVDANWRSDSDNGPSLLYQRPEGQSIVELLTPMVVTEKPLAKGAEWSVGRLLHRVEGQKQVNGKAAWRVHAGTLYGTKRTLSVDQQSPLVLAMDENVFIGQGERHDLHLELVAAKQLSEEELTKVDRAFAEMEALRGGIDHRPRTARLVWSDEQIAALREKLEPVAELTAGTPLAAIAAVAAGDTKDQKNRATALEALAKRIEGKPAPAFELATLANDTVSNKDFAGKTVVLHFWEYRDSPLEEPYGQVGYLDFLHRRRQGGDVLVYGVDVDERLGEQFSRRQAIAGAKKLKSFMNLGFPVLLDDGALLKQFGDPRVTGAKLPLFVVIGPDGKVAHYHVGYYDVDRDLGLKQLDEVVTSTERKAE